MSRIYYTSSKSASHKSRLQDELFRVESEVGFLAEELSPVLTEMLDRVTTGIPSDILSALKEAHAHESKELAKKQLEAILNSANLSYEKHLPLCQDTGLVTLFVSGELIGHLEEVERALKKSVESLTAKSGMRANVVNPLTRKNTGTNTGLNQPEVLLDKATKETTVKMILKGAGSENFTNLKMMVPTASRQEILKHILQTVIEAGGKTCPPNILGIGIGGSAIQAMFNSKIALVRKVGTRNPDPELAQFESSIAKAVNELGIGTMGLGGDTTVLDVHIETAGTHTACLPVAISFGCWANRVSEAQLRGEHFQIVR